MSFVKTWVDLETVIQGKVRKRKIMSMNTYMQNPEKWYRCSYLQNGDRDADVENKHRNTKKGRKCRMNQETGIDIYTLWIQCIK